METESGRTCSSRRAIRRRRHGPGQCAAQRTQPAPRRAHGRAMIRPRRGALARARADRGRRPAAAHLRARSVVEVCGNLKFDMTPAPELLAEGRRWRDAVRTIVLAASTREGEEAELLAAWTARSPRRGRCCSSCPGTRSVSTRSRARGRKRIDAGAPQPVGRSAARERDDRRRLARRLDGRTAAVLRARAQVALLGGSFEPLGGQNLIEAAACAAAPVLMGPHTFTSRRPRSSPSRPGPARRVATLHEAVALACEPSTRRGGASSSRCLALPPSTRGAAERMAQRIANLSLRWRGRDGVS